MVGTWMHLFMGAHNVGIKLVNIRHEPAVVKDAESCVKTNSWVGVWFVC